MRIDKGGKFVCLKKALLLLFSVVLWAMVNPAFAQSITVSVSQLNQNPVSVGTSVSYEVQTQITSSTSGPFNVDLDINNLLDASTIFPQSVGVSCVGSSGLFDCDYQSNVGSNSVLFTVPAAFTGMFLSQFTACFTESMFTSAPICNTFTLTTEVQDLTATVSVSDSSVAEEGPDTGEFTVTLSGPAPDGGLDVNYQVGGSATPGDDYGVLSGTVMIPQNQTSATILVTPVDDSILETEVETVQISLQQGVNYSVGNPSSANLTIADNEGTLITAMAAISASDPAAAEEGLDTGEFTVTLSEPAPTGGLNVNYQVGGSATPGDDYDALPGTVTIPTNAISATIIVTPVDDSILEIGGEIVQVNLVAGPGYLVGNPNSTSLTIADNEAASTSIAADISAVDANASEEGLDPGLFRVTLSGPAPESGIIIQFAVAGSAVPGSDYETLSGQATVLAGQSSVDIAVIPLSDATPNEENESVEITLQEGSGYVVGQQNLASVVIQNTPVIGPSPEQLTTNITTNVVEGQIVSGSVVLVGSGPVSLQVTTVDETAIEGSDYSPIENLNQVAARASTTLSWVSGETGPKSFQVQTIDDTDSEGTETFNLEFQVLSGNVLAPPRTTISITDNDAPPVASVIGFAAIIFEAPERVGTAGTSTVTITAERTGGTSGPITVNFSTSDGTATDQSDYIGTSGTLSWADGEDGIKSFDITILDDEIEEAGETVVLTLDNLVGDATLAIDESTLFILDDDAGEDIGLTELERQGQTAFEREMGITIEVVCRSGRAADAGTAEGDDLQDRCNEMVGAATTANRANILDPQISDALAAAAPEEYAAQGTASIETMTIQGINIRDRLVAVRSERGRNFSVAGLNFLYDGKSVPGRAFSGGAASADEAGFQRWGFFVNGSISFGDKDDNTHEAGFDFDTRGITFGADYRFDDGVVLGGAIGYTNTENDFSADGGDIEIDALTLNLYGTWYQTDSFFLDGTVAWGISDYDNTRNIRYTLGNTTVNQVADSSTDSSEFSLSLGAGYNLQINALTITPKVLFEYISTDIENYREALSDTTGLGQGLGLEINEQNEITSYTLSLGGQISYAISQNWGVLLPYGSFDYVHEFDDDSRKITGSFINDLGRQAFTISTASPDRNYFNLGLGITAQFAQGRSAFLSFDAVLGQEDVTNYSINGGIRFEF